MKTGIKLIAEERRRQVEKEGYSPSHDAKHDGGELSEAAACYAEIASAQTRKAPLEDIRDFYTEGLRDGPTWPWSDDSFKPSDDALRNLVRAGALIAAEIDRILNWTE